MQTWLGFVVLGFMASFLVRPGYARTAVTVSFDQLIRHSRATVAANYGIKPNDISSPALFFDERTVQGQDRSAIVVVWSLSDDLKEFASFYAAQAYGLDGSLTTYLVRCQHEMFRYLVTKVAIHPLGSAERQDLVDLQVRLQREFQSLQIEAELILKDEGLFAKAKEFTNLRRAIQVVERNDAKVTFVDKVFSENMNARPLVPIEQGTFQTQFQPDQYRTFTRGMRQTQVHSLTLSKAPPLDCAQDETEAVAVCPQASEERRLEAKVWIDVAVASIEAMRDALIFEIEKLGFVVSISSENPARLQVEFAQSVKSRLAELEGLAGVLAVRPMDVESTKNACDDLLK